ncbi:hypothetical protein M0R45_019969 [Rubus argutus]|uniref:Uncharacterized protein n=1 Tax=Rubus argutus TaxID=59490 RepID=A0AAW1XAJ0_RUBAR
MVVLAAMASKRRRESNAGDWAVGCRRRGRGGDLVAWLGRLARLGGGDSSVAGAEDARLCSGHELEGQRRGGIDDGSGRSSGVGLIEVFSHGDGFEFGELAVRAVGGSVDCSLVV